MLKLPVTNVRSVPTQEVMVYGSPVYHVTRGSRPWRTTVRSVLVSTLGAFKCVQRSNDHSLPCYLMELNKSKKSH